MKILVDSSDQWDFVQRLLTESRRQSDAVLSGLLPTVQQMIERDRYGELLLVSDAKHPQRFIGAVAVTMQCCCVKLLLHVVSKDYGDEETGRRAVAEAIKGFASKNQCSLIFVHVPESSGFDTEHSYYEQRAESVQSVPTVDLGTITYVLSVENI